MRLLDTEKLVKNVYSREKIRTALAICNLVATGFTVIVFLCLLVYFATDSTALLLGCIATLGVPFGLVTLLRRVINAPRPYEVYEFFDEPVENKSGESFPSRHCFSIFAIGTLCLFASVPVGIFTLALGVVLCFCRVALGFHFVRDVVTGGIIGIISSLIGGFILIL